MNETLTKLATYTVSSSGGDTMVTFNSIPQGYSDLKIVGSVRSAGTGNTVLGGLINGSYSGYSHSAVYTQDSTNASSSQSTTFTVSTTTYARLSECYFDGGSQTAGMYTSFEWYMPGYSGSNYKSSTLEFCSESNSASAYVEQSAIFWQNNAAVTSLSFVMNNGNIAQYSSFTLYGIKNMANVLGNSVRASGGTITTDGTYVYHTFAATDKFVVNQPLLATDVLVIAGGASGSQRFGNGGGAGGVSYLANKTFPIGTYPCTVGAGGAPDVVASASFGGGSPGTNSTFLSIISNGGGNGSTAGGSGGGGHGSASTSPGGASNQGNTGGATGYGNAGGNWTANSYGGGGGGGAGSAGTANGSTNGVAGGNGLNTWAYLAGPTNTGVNGYYAGGGASGANGGGPTSGGTGGLGGGGNGGGYGNFTQASGTAGVANTGSGGGGSGYSPDNTQGYSGAGGSGVVILRYKA